MTKEEKRAKCIEAMKAWAASEKATTEELTGKMEALYDQAKALAEGETLTATIDQTGYEFSVKVRKLTAADQKKLDTAKEFTIQIGEQRPIRATYRNEFGGYIGNVKTILGEIELRERAKALGVAL